MSTELRTSALGEHSFLLRIRRLTMLLTLAACVLAGALHSARAELERSLFEHTSILRALPAHWLRSEPRTLLLNGARIRVVTGRSEQPLSVMLEHFQRLCRDHSGGFHEAARRLVHPKMRELPPLIDGVLRLQDGEQGMVACLDMGERSMSADELVARFARFAEGGDLAALGGLRVVRLEARGDGTFFVATWTDGPVPLWRMFPREGDAPGIDLPTVPRPSRARRLLSAWQQNAESAIGVYQSPDAPDEAFERYTRELSAAGWQVALPEGLASAEQHAALLSRGAQHVVVAVETTEAGSLLTVMPLEAGPGAIAVQH